MDDDQLSDIFYRQKIRCCRQNDENSGGTSALLAGDARQDEHRRRDIPDYRREDSGIDTTPSNSDDNLNRDDTVTSSSDNSSPDPMKRGFETVTPDSNSLRRRRPERTTLTRGHTIDVVGDRIPSRSIHFFRQFSLCDGVLMNSVSMQDSFYLPNVVPMRGIAPSEPIGAVTFV